MCAGAEQLGIALDRPQRERLLGLLAELEEWNGRFNLTGIRAPADMLRKHLLDSLSVLPWLRGRRIADVGTGAGFPGLPLAIVRPATQFTLIESTAKKARFVEHVVQQLGLPNVSVVNDRAEAYRPVSPFDTVMCRAVGKLAEFIGYAGHLCAGGGCLLAMKGRHPTDELAALPAGWQVTAVHALEVPGLEAERHVVVLRRR
ncbi:MAG TPA: 16S rRNA (guanine(527)-N(7))-methyltransferase RsmG [Gammaproteobacteria bacterium]